METTKSKEYKSKRLDDIEIEINEIRKQGHVINDILGGNNGSMLGRDEN